MSVNKEGFPTVVFGSTLAGVYDANEGIDWDGIVREAIEVTSTVDSNIKRIGGVLRDYGNLKVTIFLDPEIDYDDFIDTADTLTMTFPISNVANGTAMIITDTASLIEFKPILAKNEVLKAEVTFVLHGSAFSWTPETT